jgi:hypothetical protein
LLPEVEEGIDDFEEFGRIGRLNHLHVEVVPVDSAHSTNTDDQENTTAGLISETVGEFHPVHVRHVVVDDANTWAKVFRDCQCGWPIVSRASLKSHDPEKKRHRIRRVSVVVYAQNTKRRARFFIHGSIPEFIQSPWNDARGMPQSDASSFQRRAPMGSFITVTSAKWP